MKNFFLFFLSTFMIISSINFVFCQGPGNPENPMTAQGARGVAQEDHILYWQNPEGTTYNQVYFSENYTLVQNLDPSVKILDGSPSTVYVSAPLSTVGTLDIFKKYYWRVVEYGTGGSTSGPIWDFKSRVSYMFNVVFLDDFSAGTINWTITNDGGTCVWEIHNATEYSLPVSAQGNVLAADAYACGNNTTTLTSATIDVYNEMGYGIAFLEIEWDNDWRVSTAQDEASVELSSDGGNTWDVIWSAVGISIRNTHELATSNFGTIPENYLIRFRTVQPGWDWWWAIDNVQVKLVGILDPNLPPDHLYAEADSILLQVNLNWDSGFFPGGPGGIYKLQRKTGLPSNPSDYVTIVEQNYNILEYVDTDVEENTNYTYRIGSFNSTGSIWGNEATAYVGIINSVNENLNLHSFSLEQNYPNPFNPTTTIKYQIPELSFVTLRVYDVLSNEIETLVNEEMPTGIYELIWNAENLPSGVYFYKLKTGYFIETKKMILIK